MKKCSKCKNVKQDTAFYSKRDSKDGLDHRCKECSKIENKKWREANKERYKEYHKKHYLRIKEDKKAYVSRYRELNYEEVKNKKRKYYYDNPEKVKDTQLRKSFGISLEQYNIMLADQSGVCALCGNTCITGRQLAVDHDHKTGRIRGLLCTKCNIWLGWLEKQGDVKEFVDRTLLYIKAVSDE